MNAKFEIEIPPFNYYEYLFEQIETIVNEYNKSDKISFLANVITVRNKYDEEQEFYYTNQKQTKFNFRKDLFEIANLSYTAESVDINKADEIDAVSKKTAVKVLAHFDHLIKVLNDYESVIEAEEIVNDFNSLLNKLNDTLDEDLKFIDSDIESIQMLFYNLVESFRVKAKFQSLDFLIHKARYTGSFYEDFSPPTKEDIRNFSNAGNPNFKKEWEFSDEFLIKAKELTEKDQFDQKSIYSDLIDEFYSDSDKEPSFITVWRELKEKEIW